MCQSQAKTNVGLETFMSVSSISIKLSVCYASPICLVLHCSLYDIGSCHV